ncbi:PAS domain S-box protein [Phormidium sp. CCY1219]|uniref:PAS domain S-box protein n=1 Tax=Phormidium sp. CCY1219 TaxID=2886104 RepID=UPI002D1EBA9C|nr:PAS domain S-box protein [Phormidium sp. CCY1219]MEB3830063.1 PAS domain S-box protein [Phormidium sp. CCY1219]
MNDSTGLKILLVEDRIREAELIKDIFSETESIQVELTHVENLTGAIAHLNQQQFDVILLDLSLPDSQGLHSLQRILNFREEGRKKEAIARAQMPPIVVFTGIDDEQLAADAIQVGAQDYLVKGKIDARSLVNALRHAIGRGAIQQQLQQTSAQLQRSFAERTAELSQVICELQTQIEQRQQVETALESSYNLWYAVVEGTSDPIFVKDLEGRYLLVNSSCALLFGRSPEDIFGKDDTDLLPSDVAFGIRWDDSNVMASGQTKVVEQVMPIQGETHTFLCTKSPYSDAEGNVIGLIVIARDISDRIAIEQQLKQFAQKQSLLIRQTALAVIEWNHQLEITGWNPAASAIFGYSRAEAIGRNFSFLRPQNTKKRQGMATACLTNSGGYRIVKENVTKSGKKILCEWYNTPLSDRNDRPIGAISLVLDITDRVAAEETLRRKETILRRQNDALVQLTTCDRLKAGALKATCQQITAVAAETLEVDRVSIWLPVADKSHWECAAIYDGHTQAYLRGENFNYANYGDYFQALVTQRTLALNNRREIVVQLPTFEIVVPEELNLGDTASRGNRQPPSLARLDAGIRLGGEVVGLVCCERTQSDRQWLLEERQFAASIADLVALGIEQRDRYLADEQLRQYRERLEELVEERTAQLERINNRLQQEQTALRHSEEKYRSVVENIKEVIFQTDDRGCWTFLNPAWTKIIGYSIAESLGQPILNFIHPDDRAASGERFAALMSGEQEECHCQIRCLTKRGETRWLEVFGIRQMAADGTVVGASGTLNDITDRVFAEQSLRESENRYRAIVEDQTELICRFLPDGTLTFVNQAYCRFVGMSREACIGQPMNRMVCDADRDKIERYHQSLLKLTPEEPVRTIEHQALVQGEARIYHWSDRAIFDGTGNIIEFQAIGRDISDRKAAEAQLQQKNAEMEAIFAVFPDLFFRLASDGTILDYKADKEVLHLPPEEFLGHRIQEVLPEPVNRKFDEAIALVQQANSIVTMEYSLPKSDGEEHYEARVVPFQNQQTIAIIRNISDKVRFERALRETSERLDSILGSIDDVLWSVSLPSYERIYMNPAAEKISGHSLGEFFANSHLWLEILHPDDRPRVEAKMQEILATGSADLEYRIVRPDGEVRWLRDRARVLYDKSGTPIRMDGLATDISDRKHYEAALERERQQLRQIVTHAPVAMAVFDSEMRYLAHSNRWKCDYHLAEDAIGLCHYDLLPDIPPRWKTLYQKALQGEAISCAEDLWERDDGSKVYLNWAIHPWYTPELTVGGIAIASTAIDELVQAREAALEAARLKSQFLANMSHEIRTPMNGVLGMTELLLKTPLTSQQLDFVKTLKVSGENLLTIINDILDFSKLEAGEMRLDCHDFNLTRTLEEVVDLFALQAAPKGVEIVLFIDPKLPRSLQGDASRLRQVLANLVGNAVKFTDAGEVIVEVKPHPQSTSSSSSDIRLCFAIKDTGIGISKRDRQKLFQSFSQIDSSSTRKYGGTGLGLAICQQLVQLMQGKIGVESEIGIGSTFWFTAQFKPAKLSQTTDRLLPQISEGTVAVSHPSVPLSILKSQNLLVVDDNPTNRQLIRLQASNWGMNVTEVTDGLRAIKTLRKAAAAGNPYPVALLDMQMPKMDGETLGELILSEPALGETKLIMMTSVNESNKAKPLLESGFSGYLIKPVKEYRLLECLLQVLGGQSPILAGQEQETQKRLPAEFAPEKSAEPVEQLQNPLHVLLVEDTPINQKVILNQLDRLGAIADCANNGQEALDKLQERQYDIVLMDCQMPILDGYQTTQAIREAEGSNPHAIVIGLTAYAMKGDREKCLAAGMDDYLSKPVSLEDLSNTICRWIHPGETCPLSASNLADPLALLPGENSTVVDGDRLQQISQGNEEFARELLQAFAEDAKTYLTQATEAIASEDCATVAKVAHQLKGGAGTVGVRFIPEIAAFLEQLAKKNQLANATSLVVQMHEICDRLDAFLPQLHYNDQNSGAKTSPPPLPEVKNTPAIDFKFPASIVDRERLNDIARGDMEFALELLQAFADDAATYLAQAFQALEVQDWDTLARKAHQLKGGSATVAVRIIPEVAANLQERAKKNHRENAEKLLIQLQQALDGLNAFIAAQSGG